MSNKRQKQRVGCSIEVNRHGYLRLRFRWQGRRISKGTKLRDTPENRRKVERLAKLVGATITAGRSPLPLLEITEPGETGGRPASLTVKEYYSRWIDDKVPPLVRKAQAYDYRRHIEKYVLPKLGSLRLADLRGSDLFGLRADLLRRGLSVKYVKNIISASFRALVIDACAEGLIEVDPYVVFRQRKWPRAEDRGPDPFTAEEAESIIGWFRAKVYGGSTGGRLHVPYYAYIHAGFWTGMRLSELSGLQWRDVDLPAGTVFVRRSRHLGEYNATKTRSATRAVRLVPDTSFLLGQIRPPHVAPDRPVFTNTQGGPVEPNTLSWHWYRCLDALGIRKRGMYQMKHTYVSLALTKGVNVHWLEQQTGVSYATLRKHYGKYMDAEGDDQIAKLVDLPQSGARLAHPLAHPDLDNEGFQGVKVWSQGESNPRLRRERPPS